MDKIILLLFAAAACCVGEDETFFYPGHEFSRTTLGDSVDRASIKMLKEVYDNADDKNVIASPLGVLILLALYSSGAPGPNQEEIVQALGSVNYTELFNSYTGLSQRFSEMDASYLVLANKVYLSKKYDLDEKFSEVAVNSYKSEVEAIDFGDPKTTVAAINKWADEKSKGHIKDPVPDDAIDSGAAAALFNIIFFQGHWNIPFQANETTDKDFYLDKTNTVKKPTMQLQQSLFYHDCPELGARMVELPYKEQDFRMVVVLPNEVDGLPSLLEKATQRGLLSDVFALEPAGREILFEMPKFEIKTGLDLNKILPKVGVSKIFTEGASGIVKQQPVVVSKAFQEAFVKVDEEGATAGAFTGLVIVPTSLNSQPPPPIEFKANHPFLFVILNRDIVLFSGIYTH